MIWRLLFGNGIGRKEEGECVTIENPRRHAQRQMSIERNKVEVLYAILNIFLILSPSRLSSVLVHGIY